MLEKYGKFCMNFNFEQIYKKFLTVFNGAFRAPIGLLKNLKPKFKIQRNGPDTASLPTSCQHVLIHCFCLNMKKN